MCFVPQDKLPLFFPLTYLSFVLELLCVSEAGPGSLLSSLDKFTCSQDVAYHLDMAASPSTLWTRPLTSLRLSFLA